MTIKVYDPRISLVLKKNVGRKTVSGGTPTSQRFQGAARTVDLSLYLGDAGSVTTSKDIRAPAGMFTIVLADKMEPQQQETLYGLIEPMDMIEIRMARDPSQHKGVEKNMPIAMRGFVTEVTRDEGMGPDGPYRTVTIRGQDYGKILQIMQIAYLPNEVTGSLVLTYFKFFENYNDSSSPNKPAGTFIAEVVTNVVNAFIADMQGAAGGGASPVQTIVTESTVSDGIVAPFGTIQTFEGTVYELMCRYGDVGPWNELFVEDRETGPVLVYRPTPFKDTGGAMIQGGDAPESVSVTDKDLTGLSVTRTDAATYNYYWVDPQTFNLNTPGYLAVEAAHSGDANRFFLADYPNSSPKLYGFRRLEVSTMQGPRFDGKAEKDYEKTQLGPSLDFVAKRRKVLIENNRDNVVFETGTMQLKGDERIKAGMTIKLKRARAGVSEYYAVGVQQFFRPFKTFTTTVAVERGTGFIDRVKKSQGSPYLEEINVGGAYADAK